MSMKINRLEIENVKRIKAVKLEPAQNGLTIIGGDNQQGKTSVLDSIACFRHCLSSCLADFQCLNYLLMILYFEAW